jgi:hypothetical protein
MKIKIDITAPVQLNSLTEGSLSLPRLQKMNFGVSSSMSDEQRWVDANTSISAPGWIRISGTEQPLENNFRILIPYPGIELPSGSIRVPLRQDATTLRSRFSSETKNQIVEQSFRTSSVPPPPSLILVVDGSAVMKERLSLIEELIDSISSTTKLSVYFAGDNVEELVTSQTIPTDWVKSRLQERLRQQSYQGATDNGVALLAALQETRRLQGESIIPKQQPRVIWLHAQQPYLFASYEVVGNFLEKNESIEPIISIQTDYERGEIAQESVPFSRVEYRLTSSESLSLISCRLLGTHECIERDFTVKPASQISSTLGNAGLHLTYLWGAREVRRMVNEGETSEAMKLATELKIVTPVTSAIVLETERDYEESGITPPTGTGGTKPGAISGTIPTTPEPEDIALIALLVMLTGFTMLHHRRSPWANHG